MQGIPAGNRGRFGVCLIAHLREEKDPLRAPMARQWQDRYPGVDIILIEPEPDDELMFETSVLNYSSRVEVAKHGFESVTVKLAKDYDQLRDVCERHGIQISATRVRKVVEHYGAEKEKTRAWRRILEQTTGTLLRQSAGEQ